MHFAFSHKDLLIGILLVLAVAVAALGIHYVLFRFLRGRQQTTRGRWGIRKYLANPARAVLFAIVIYLGSYYLVRKVWGPQFKADELNKMYTTGIGSYVLLFIFLYIFLFTLGIHYLSL